MCFAEYFMVGNLLPVTDFMAIYATNTIKNVYYYNGKIYIETTMDVTYSSTCPISELIDIKFVKLKSHHFIFIFYKIQN